MSRLWNTMIANDIRPSLGQCVARLNGNRRIGVAMEKENGNIQLLNTAQVVQCFPIDAKAYSCQEFSDLGQEDGQPPLTNSVSNCGAQVEHGASRMAPRTLAASGER